MTFGLIRLLLCQCVFFFKDFNYGEWLSTFNQIVLKNLLYLGVKSKYFKIVLHTLYNNYISPYAHFLCSNRNIFEGCYVSSSTDKANYAKLQRKFCDMFVKHAKARKGQQWESHNTGYFRGKQGKADINGEHYMEMKKPWRKQLLWKGPSNSADLGMLSTELTLRGNSFWPRTKHLWRNSVLE